MIAPLRMMPVGLLAALWAATAAAGTGRSFVSGHGIDTGACSPTAPCRSFAYAASQTNAGGEITVLDPAGYGAVTISQAVSIINDGVGEAGITVATTGQDAITISAGASDQITLRGLTLVGQGLGKNGITLNSIGTLNIQNCVVRGFTGSGLNLLPTAAANINVVTTIVSNNQQGIMLLPSGSATVTAAFERVQALGNTNSGFLIDGASSTGSVVASAANSVAARNGGAGFEVITSGTPTSLTLDHVRSVYNLVGVESTGVSGLVNLRKSAIAGNRDDGYFVGSSAVIKTYGDNYLIATSNIGSLTSAAVQ